MSATSLRVDAIDRRIIARMRVDARQSFGEVGQHVGLSASAVKRRVDRLRRAGVIRGFAAVVDPVMLGWTTEAYVELYCGSRTSPDEILRGVADFPEVVSAVTVTGEADALVHVRATDVGHFERVMERIGAQPHVERTKSFIVLSHLLRRRGPDGQNGQYVQDL